MFGVKNKKSIAFISPLVLPLLRDPPQAGPGGAERQFFLFGRALKRKGWSVCYVTDNNDPGKKEKTIMPVELASFSFLRGGKRRILLDLITIMYAMWRANSYYYVLKTPAYLLVPMHLFTWIFRRKLVFWAQMEFDAYPELRPFKRTVSMLLDMGTERADIILAQNRSQVEGFKKNFGKEAKLIQNISGYLSGQNGQTNDTRERIDVLWVGNSMAKKRYEVVVALAKMLPDYSFALAMNKADSARYLEAEARCNLVDNIEFLGEVNQSEMETWYGKARLLLNTSTQEGFPNTYLQAWQHGMPVVSVCIDPDDVVSKYDLGIVIDKRLTRLSDGDEEQYAKKLITPVEKLLTDGLLYDRISQNVRAYVSENHDETVLVGRLEKLLLEG